MLGLQPFSGGPALSGFFWDAPLKVNAQETLTIRSVSTARVTVSVNERIQPADRVTGVFRSPKSRSEAISIGSINSSVVSPHSDTSVSIPILASQRRSLVATKYHTERPTFLVDPSGSKTSSVEYATQAQFLSLSRPALVVAKSWSDSHTLSDDPRRTTGFAASGLEVPQFFDNSDKVRSSAKNRTEIAPISPASSRNMESTAVGISQLTLINAQNSVLVGIRSRSEQVQFLASPSTRLRKNVESVSDARFRDTPRVKAVIRAADVVSELVVFGALNTRLSRYAEYSSDLPFADTQNGFSNGFRWGEDQVQFSSLPAKSVGKNVESASGFQLTCIQGFEAVSSAVHAEDTFPTSTSSTVELEIQAGYAYNLPFLSTQGGVFVGFRGVEEQAQFLSSAAKAVKKNVASVFDVQFTDSQRPQYVSLAVGRTEELQVSGTFSAVLGKYAEYRYDLPFVNTQNGSFVGVHYQSEQTQFSSLSARSVRKNVESASGVQFTDVQLLQYVGRAVHAEDTFPTSTRSTVELKTQAGYAYNLLLTPSSGSVTKIVGLLSEAVSPIDALYKSRHVGSSVYHTLPLSSLGFGDSPKSADQRSFLPIIESTRSLGGKAAVSNNGLNMTATAFEGRRSSFASKLGFSTTGWAFSRLRKTHREVMQFQDARNKTATRSALHQLFMGLVDRIFSEKKGVLFRSRAERLNLNEMTNVQNLRVPKPITEISRVEPIDNFIRQGFANRIKQQFRCAAIPCTGTDKMRNLRTYLGSNPEYPFIFMTFGTALSRPASYRDTKLARIGVPVTMNSDGNSYQTAYLLPTELDVEISYVDSSYEGVEDFMRRWFFARRNGALAFNVDYGLSQVSIVSELGESMQMPVRSDQIQAEGVYTVSVNAKLNGYTSEPDLQTRGRVTQILYED